MADRDKLAEALRSTVILMQRGRWTWGELASALLDSPALREMQAEAWDEGYTSGHSNAMRRMSDEPNAPTTPNPYKEKPDDQD